MVLDAKEDKNIKIGFTDFSGDLESSFIYKYVSEKYTIDNKNPDLLICDIYGRDKNKYECTKLQVCFENINRWRHTGYKSCLDLTCDYNIVNHINFPRDHVYVTNVVTVYDIKKHIIPDPVTTDLYFNINQPGVRVGIPERFTSFLFRNMYKGDPGVNTRVALFDELNKYKPIETARNIDTSSLDKELSSLSEYKFNICIENSYGHGYFTDKPFKASLVGSIPIYHADPSVLEYLNKDSMVWLEGTDIQSITKAIDEVKMLDTNDDKYQEKRRKPLFDLSNPPKCILRETVYDYIDYVVSNL